MGESEISREQINKSTEEQELGPTLIAGRVTNERKAAAEKFEEKTGKPMKSIPKAINKLNKEKGPEFAKVILDEGQMKEETVIDGSDRDEK